MYTHLERKCCNKKLLMFKVRRNALYRTDFLFDVKALNNFFILEIKVCSLNTTNIHDVF